jgi:preprotein translocase subunit SecG
MSSVLLAIVVLLAVLIIVSVLMQPSKADGGLGGLASGMTSDVLGASSNDFLAKATWWMFGIFVVSCLFFGKMKANENAEILQEKNTKSALELQVPAKAEEATPVKAEEAPVKVEEVPTKAEEATPAKAE